MVKWHEDEAKLSRQCRASVVDGAQGNKERGGSRRGRRKSYQGNGGRGSNRRGRRETAEAQKRKETTGRVAWNQAD